MRVFLAARGEQVVDGGKVLEEVGRAYGTFVDEQRGNDTFHLAQRAEGL